MNPNNLLLGVFMPQYNHISFDIETFDTKTTAVIVSIAAVLFNPEDRDSFSDFDNKRCYSALIDTEQQIAIGRTVSGDTIKWWLQQSDKAQKGLLGNAFGVVDALDGLTDFVKKNKAQYAWGNGNMFDNAIIRSLYEDASMQYPFNYWADLDLRTLAYVAGNPKKPAVVMTAHNALDDAKYQALCAQHYFGFINGEKT